MSPREGSRRIVPLETKPTHAERGVAGDERHRDQQAERAKRVERTSAERVEIRVHTLYESADDEALRDCGHDGAAGEHDVPPSPRICAVVTKLERHAPEPEREQHEDD